MTASLLRADKRKGTGNRFLNRKQASTPVQEKWEKYGLCDRKE